VHTVVVIFRIILLLCSNLLRGKHNICHTIINATTTMEE
jgi:hypothetical protein